MFVTPFWSWEKCGRRERVEVGIESMDRQWRWNIAPQFWLSSLFRYNQDNQRSVGKEHFRRSMQPLKLGYVMEAVIFFEKKESRIIDSCSLRDSQGSTAV